MHQMRDDVVDQSQASRNIQDSNLRSVDRHNVLHMLYVHGSQPSPLDIRH